MRPKRLKKIRSFDEEFVLAQSEQLGQFGASQCVDIHCHCLPGLDDGPATMSEAIALCKALAADGITTAIATPHQLGRFDGCYDGPEIRQVVADLNQVLKKQKIPLTVVPGAEVRVDERIPQLLQSDHILTLADMDKYILLELPLETFIDLGPLLADLHTVGVKTVISHPERNAFLEREPGQVLKWAQYSPCLQITAASLVGDFGSSAQRAAWQFLNMSLPTLVATDAHSTDSKPPRMAKAFELITHRWGKLVAGNLCIDNPVSILNGQDVLPLTGLAEKDVRRWNSSR